MIDNFEDMGREDFAKMLEESLSAADNFETGDKVQGTIVNFSPEYAFVNISGKSEALMSISEFTDAGGSLTAKKGDAVTAYIVSIKGGEIMLTSRIGSGAASHDVLKTAYGNSIPVEGHVTEAVKGGFSVSVSGIKCFCPFSQIDIRPESESFYIGKTFSFKITLYGERGKNIILSRRVLLETERKEKEDELRKNLKQGDTVTGTVSSVQSFGVFVDIDGADALVPRSELSWARNASPSDFTKGDSISALVADIDWDNNRISLSIKRLQPEPWSAIDKFAEGSTVNGCVTNIIKTGAFVELNPGLEGFIHVSRMSLTKRVAKPEDVLQAGDTVAVRIISIDHAQRKISLELADGDDPWQTHTISDALLLGVVEDSKPFGAHIRLSNGMLGFAPKEKLAVKNTDIQKEFPPGREVSVVITEMDRHGRKLILSVRDAQKIQEKNEFMEFSGRHASSASTLGSMLKDKFAELQKKVE
ncbi:MAG: S1 RNA-binding domain-containing protein [Spirochaetia bacterium]|jgi:small subunit ribosomal protein S1|nr:S1 RNA-binding domain-containing protein [Spirochaetia bacterium]